MVPRAFRLAPLLATLTLGSCGSTPDFEGRDEGLFYPTVRVSRHVEANSAGRIFFPEVQVSHGSGEFGTTEFDFTEGLLGGFMPLSHEDRFQPRLLAGLGYHALDIEDGLFDGDEDTFGPYTGLALHSTLHPRIELYGRTTFLVTVDSLTSWQAEAGLAILLFEPVRLLAGYRYWRVQHEDLETSLTDAEVDVRSEGLFAGLELLF